MTLSHEQRTALIANYREKAEIRLQKAYNLTGSAPDDSVVHAYYAVFNFIQALFLEEGVYTTKKRGHRSIIGLLDQEFVRSGRLPRDVLRHIGELEKARLTSDYEVCEKITESKAKECVERADIVFQFIEEMKKMEQTQENFEPLI